LVAEQIDRTLFQNTTRAAIRINLVSVNETIRKADHGNTFDLAPGVPPVLVVDSDLEPVLQWYGLGGDYYYLIDTDWIQTGDLIINAGVHLKFKSGRSFIRGFNPFVTLFAIKGEPGNPVIFDGEAGTPGSWGGLMLADGFRIEHLIIKNGGEFILPNATEKANIVSAYIRGNGDQEIFRNSTISNSAGWGIVVESGTWNFEFDDPAKNNTFSNNASGDIIIKP
jgi:hypothetical protein